MIKFAFGREVPGVQCWAEGQEEQQGWSSGPGHPWALEGAVPMQGRSLSMDRW